MTLRRFSYVMSAAFLVLVSVAAVLLTFITSRMRESSMGTENAIRSIRATEELQVHLLNHHRQALLQELTKSKAGQSTVPRARENVLYWLAEVGTHVDQNNDEEKKLFAETSQAVQRYLEVPGDLMGPILDDAFRDVELLTSLNLQQAEFYQQRLRSDDNLANTLAILIIVFALLVIPASLLMVRNNLYKPIAYLHRSIRDFPGTGSINVKEVGLVETREIATAFNELMARLSEQKKSQLRFLAGVAHDLRNPLSAIKMSSEILAEGSMEPREALPIIQIISRQAEQLDRMVGDLLDSTRIEAGQLELQKKPENLVSIVHDATKLYGSVSQLHEIRFSTNVPRIDCVCDRTRISQVVNNLLSNAIKYSPNGGVIQVTAGTQGGFAIVQVQDQGIGIKVEDQDHIFEPFRRTALTKSSIPGVGLGLSVVKRIINAHEGEISVHSEPDKGSTFTFKVPLASEVQAQPHRDLVFH